MAELSWAVTACAGLFAAGLVTAMIYDLGWLRIPNWLNLTLALMALPYWVLVPITDWPWHLATGLGLFAAAFALFALRALGGGDVKLVGAVGLWIGPHLLPVFLLVMGLLGGLVALLLLILRPLATRWLPAERCPPALQHGAGIPYGLAIAPAAWLAFLPGM